MSTVSVHLKCIIISKLFEGKNEKAKKTNVFSLFRDQIVVAYQFQMGRKKKIPANNNSVFCLSFQILAVCERN